MALDMDSNPEAKPPVAWAVGDGRKAAEKVWIKTYITLYANGGVWVKMEEAGVEGQKEGLCQFTFRIFVSL